MKYKINKSQEFVIGGYTAGNPFDALIVGYYQGTKLKVNLAQLEFFESVNILVSILSGRNSSHMLRSRMFLAALTLLAGVALGGYLFSDSRPRSFLALSSCDSCYRPNDLAGLLASAGIQGAAAAAPLAVKETARCVAIEHPFRKAKFHFVVFPKKDIKNIADVAIEDQQHILDCLAVIRALVVENGLRSYRVETNGPGLQHVTYLHFHLVSSDGHAQPHAPADAPQAARR